jgi:predicted ATPase/Tfp pilus assembly protein PilF
MPTNLRPQRTSFLGRGVELTAVEGFFAAGASHVTLTGPGGVGKTRLAIRVGESMLETSGVPGGVWFVDLADARSMPAIVTAIARALDLSVMSDDPVGRVVEALATRGRSLVILDNCEQALADIAAVVVRLRETARSTYILSTSRERLRIAGEQVFPLSPLALPRAGATVEDSEALRLFVERARLVRPGYAPDAARCTHIARIVDAVDGLPLGIELAAAWMASFDEAALLDRLRGSLDLLAIGPRDSPDRHQELRETIGWSWDLLDAEERAALAQCAVFRGGFSLELAERVVDRPSRRGIAEVIGALHAKSLVRRLEPPSAQGGARFGLYETIRVFAAEKLEELGLSDRTVTRFCDAMLEIGSGWVERVSGRAGIEAVEAIGVELENLAEVQARGLASGGAEGVRRALGAVTIAGRYLELRGPTDRFVAMLDSALAAPGHEAPENLRLKAGVFVDRAMTHYRSGRATIARADVEEALRQARATGDTRNEGRASRVLARIHAESGHVEESRHWFERAIDLMARSGDTILLAATRGDFGGNLVEQGDFERGRPLYEAALDILADRGSPALEGLCRVNFAMMFHRQGRLDEAKEHYERGLRTLREIRVERWVGTALDNLGLLHQELGRHDAARRCFEEALGRYRSIAEQRAVGTCLANLAGLEHELGQLEAACARYDEAIAALRRAEPWPRVAVLTAARGAASAWRGRIEDADAAFAFAEAQLAGKDPQLAAAVRLYAGLVDVARASRAEGGAVEAHLGRARETLEASEPLCARSDEVRLPFRLLRHALERATATQVTSRESEDPTAFLIDRSGAWFRVPGAGRVDLRRRSGLRRILARLVRRLEEAGDALLVEDLVAAGRPDDRISKESGATRAYTALTTLRTLGLREALQSEKGMYQLSKAARIIVVGDEPRKA